VPCGQRHCDDDVDPKSSVKLFDSHVTGAVVNPGQYDFFGHVVQVPFDPEVPLKQRQWLIDHLASTAVVDPAPQVMFVALLNGQYDPIGHGKHCPFVPKYPAKHWQYANPAVIETEFGPHDCGAVEPIGQADPTGHCLQTLLTLNVPSGQTH
jgi:hypothetical protein